MAKMKTLPKLVLFVGVTAGAVFGLKQAVYYGLIPRPNALKTLVPLKAEVVDAKIIDPNLKVKITPLPSQKTASLPGDADKWWVMPWNAQMALMFANGGPVTTDGSLMAKQGVRLQIEKQSDTGPMQNELVAFATNLSKGESTANNVKYVVVMGDGSAAFLAGVNPALKKLGSEYIAEVIDGIGFSRNEDKLMGPADWKTNPQSARGALIAGVLRDGDWNIAMRWAQINNIPNNPDEKTYDEDALNWVATDTFTDAAEKYVSGYCEDRPLKGKKGTKHICVNGVVTWTPGDVTVAKKRGGLVTIMSTKDAVFQMPAAVIGIKKWNAQHADRTSSMLAAIHLAADQVRANPAALRRAAEVSAQVYKEQNADYWLRYYTGVTERDLQGMSIELGGSAVANLADAYQLFGLDGGPNIFKATYETFGDITKQQYPNVLKSYPPVSEVVNTTYLRAAAAKMPSEDSAAPAESITYTTAPMREVVGRRNYQILFETGSAKIDAKSFKELDGIVNDFLTSKMKGAIHGHTDNTGTPDGNVGLSEQRAFSVKQYLMAKGGRAIPDTRLKVVAHGQSEPIAPNDTKEGRALNRRVELVIGSE